MTAPMVSAYCSRCGKVTFRTELLQVFTSPSTSTNWCEFECPTVTCKKWSRNELNESVVLRLVARGAMLRFPESDCPNEVRQFARELETDDIMARVTETAKNPASVAL